LSFATVASCAVRVLRFSYSSVLHDCRIVALKCENNVKVELACDLVLVLVSSHM